MVAGVSTVNIGGGAGGIRCDGGGATSFGGSVGGAESTALVGDGGAVANACDELDFEG